jgi:hypothetical protein
LVVLVLVAWCSGLAAKAAPEERVGARVDSSRVSSTNLPIILLEVKEGIVSERKVACSARLLLPPGTKAAVGRSDNAPACSGLVRVHGGVSQVYPKKSYGLTLETPAPWLDLRQSAHWVLNAAFIDRSLLRHKLSYDLFRSLSGPGTRRYASESRFVEVYLNGQYQGAYLLMERVDRTLLELQSYDSNAPTHACIYKAVDHAANFSHPGEAGFEQREPEALVAAYWGPLQEFNQFVSRASDAEFYEGRHGISARVDIANAIDFHLLVLLTSNVDGITKNFILARDALATNAPGRAPRFFFAPWDYDATFGRNWNATRVESTGWLSNHLFDRLHKDAAFRKQFAARWKQLRERQFSVANIHRMIDENVRALGPAARRNSARWASGQGMYPDRLSFEEDVAEMKEWTVARLKWLDAEIEQRGR